MLLRFSSVKILDLSTGTKCSSCNFSAFHIRYTRYRSSYWGVYWSISCTPRLSAVCSDLRLWDKKQYLESSRPFSLTEPENFCYTKGSYYTCCALHSFYANSWESTQSKLPQKLSPNYLLTWVFSVANKVNLFSYEKPATLSVSWATVQQNL